MNERRQLAAAAVVHGKIFCCGDWDEETRLSSTECYDPSSDVWTLICYMPGPNAGCGIVVIDAHLIVIGGMASINKDYLNSVWVLDTTHEKAKWIEREPCLSRPLCQFSIAKIDSKIFVCGGICIDKEDSKLHSTNDVKIFDGEVWRNGPKLPTYRYLAPAVVVSLKFVRSLN